MKTPFSLLYGSLLGFSLLLMQPRAAQAQPSTWQGVTGPVLGSGAAISNRPKVAVDAAGNLFFSGDFTGSLTFGATTLTSTGYTAGGMGNQPDVFVAKFVPGTGTWAWALAVGGQGSEFAYGLTAKNGNVYFTGSLDNNLADAATVRFGGSGASSRTVAVPGASTTVSADLFVAKLIDAGSSAIASWVQVGGGIGSDAGYDIAVSGSNVYVTGSITNTLNDANRVRFGSGVATVAALPQAGASTANSMDMVVAGYTDNGSTAPLRWLQVAGGTGFDYGQGIAASGTSVYVTGAIENDLTDSKLVRLGGSGTTAGSGRQNGASTSALYPDLLLARYTDFTTSATLDWTQVAGGSSNDMGSAVAVSGSSVYVTGYIVNNLSDSKLLRFGGSGTTAGTIRQNGASTLADFADLVVAKYTDNNTSAALAWAQVGGGTDIDAGKSIVVSGPNVYVGGGITNNVADAGLVRFGGSGTATGSVVRPGGSTAMGPDALVAKYVDNGSSASLSWTQIGGGSDGYDMTTGLAISGTTLQGFNLYASGNTSQGAPFGSYRVPGPTTATGYGTAFLGFFTQAGVLTATRPATNQSSALAWPNPAHGSLTVRLPTSAPAATPLELTDALGRVVRGLPAPTAGTDISLSLAGLPAGLYTLRCGSLHQQLVVE